MFKINVKKRDIKVPPIPSSKIGSEFTIDYVGHFEAFVWIKEKADYVAYYKYDPPNRRWVHEKTIRWYVYQDMKKRIEDEMENKKDKNT